MVEKEWPIYIWLDDIRPNPEGWVWAHSVNEAIELFENNIVHYLSLDHDMGGAPGGDGVALVDWMTDNRVWPERGVVIHSMNPVGRRVMMQQIDRQGPYEPAFGNNFRGTWVNENDPYFTQKV